MHAPLCFKTNKKEKKEKKNQAAASFVISDVTETDICLSDS